MDGHNQETLVKRTCPMTLGHTLQALMIHLMAILIFGVLIAGVNNPNLVDMWASMPFLYYISGNMSLVPPK
jgi:hypothetical protein